jgi:biopolymer transport protein TolR
MGMSVGAQGGGGGGRRRNRRARKHGAIADINMTPFIDVMLVLLIIFMVAAPLIATGVPIDLPQTAAKPINIDQKPLTISITQKGEIFMQDVAVSDTELLTRLQAAAKQGFDERIYVRGHKQVDYGRVATVMSAVTAAGYKRVALVTEPSS